jgi:hypothetical protein
MNLTQLLSLSPQQFEVAVSGVLARLGYYTEVTKYTGDGGIDIWARSSELILGGKIIVQCKRYAPHVTVGEPVLRDLYGLVISSGANKGLVVTTSSFTPAAVQFASGKPLELLDGDMLRSLFDQEPGATNPISSFELDLKMFNNVDALSENIFLWSKTVPKPYPLQVKAEFLEWWDTYWSNWGLSYDGLRIADLVFRSDFIAALSSLLWDAKFRGGAPDLLPRLTAALNPVCVIAIGLLKEKGGHAEIELGEELSKPTYERRMEHMSLAQSEVEPLCVRYW